MPRFGLRMHHPVVLLMFLCSDGSKLSSALKERLYWNTQVEQDHVFLGKRPLGKYEQFKPKKRIRL